MDDANITFSNHAKRKLEKRKIDVKLIKLAISNPNKLVIYNNKFFAYRQFGKLYLKVVFGKVAKNTIIVITQYFIKKLP
jgi:hypothetical protein